MIDDHDDEIVERIINMWKLGKVLPSEVDPKERVKQVVTAALDANGYVVGVNTAYPTTIAHGVLEGTQVYAMRQFILSASREFALNKKLLWSSFDILASIENPIEGIVLVLENKKLTRKGYTKRYGRIGFVKISNPNNLQEIWYKPFGTKLGEPLAENFLSNRTHVEKIT